MIRARFGWDPGASPSDLAAGARDYRDRLLTAILDLARFFAAKVEAWARRNARWTDRTGNARSGLTARALPIATGAVIVLFGTVGYQVFLELANAGRFAIILKALEAHHADVMAALRRLVA
jgi:type II secretory pathway component PulM